MPRAGGLLGTSTPGLAEAEQAFSVAPPAHVGYDGAMKHCIPLLAAGIVVFLPVGAHGRPAAPEGSSAELKRARTLYRQKEYAAALAALEAHRRALPPGARLSRWSLDFEGHAVPVVL